MSQFSEEFPFDQIVGHPTMGDPGVGRLATFIGRYPSRAPATLEGFKKFRRLLKSSDAPWKEKLEAFLRKMISGAYAGEFGKFANLSETGHIEPGVVSTFGVYECSQVSELFSLFCQALHYNEDLDDEAKEGSKAV